MGVPEKNVFCCHFGIYNIPASKKIIQNCCWLDAAGNITAVEWEFAVCKFLRIGTSWSLEFFFSFRNLCCKASYSDGNLISEWCYTEATYLSNCHMRGRTWVLHWLNLVLTGLPEAVNPKIHIHPGPATMIGWDETRSSRIRIRWHLNPGPLLLQRSIARTTF